MLTLTFGFELLIATHLTFATKHPFVSQLSLMVRKHGNTDTKVGCLLPPESEVTLSNAANTIHEW
jgi:hypothetical protein